MAARRRKPCSRIEAKLRLRRCRNISENKREEKALRRTSSSSTNENSPRFISSKQHVELVDFEARRYLQIQRSKKNCENSFKCAGNKKIHVEEKKPRKTLSETFIKVTDMRSIIDDLRGTKSRDVLGDDLENPSNIGNDLCKRILEKRRQEDFEKRRSRSAPCRPLFKIKCVKGKCPRDLFVERIPETEETRRCKRNPRSLRISRSGDVSVTSSQLSNNNGIERISLEDFAGLEKNSETIILVESHVKLQNEHKEEFTDKEVEPKENIENEQVFVTELQNLENENSVNIQETANKKSKENIDLQEESKLSSSQENIPITVETVEKIPEKVLTVQENFAQTLREFTIVANRASSRKPLKNHVFKWETLLERQHRQISARSPENRRKIPDVPIGGVVNSSMHCENSRGNLIAERRNLDAYSVIREELPKILMKRRFPAAIQDCQGQKAEDSRLKSWQEKLAVSPERRKALGQFQGSSIIQRGGVQILTTRRDSVENKRKYYLPVSERMFHVSQNRYEVSNSRQSACRASILKQRKPHSPRRVTFRLPAREVEEIHQENFCLRGDNYCHINSIQEFTNGNPVKEFSDEFVENTVNRRLLGNRNEEKSRRFISAENSHQCWSPPRFVPIEMEDDNESENFEEQDWEISPDRGNSPTLRDVKFPKETRQAMKILIRAREDAQRSQSIGTERIEILQVLFFLCRLLCVEDLQEVINGE